ncbi:MAG TPA: ammonium transporter [Pyrodictium delaneyi]|uniref:Ammonium transporter n=1 Tax=Pyrodictium delaneyi TaxID=1273541 RepID=A0A832ZUB4_9CREN|nr:ammonium transporter [Pyrodictium delaneyi]
MTFAAIILAIPASALAERTRLGAFLVFSLLCATPIYDQDRDRYPRRGHGQSGQDNSGGC